MLFKVLLLSSFVSLNGALNLSQEGSLLSVDSEMSKPSLRRPKLDLKPESKFEVKATTPTPSSYYTFATYADSQCATLIVTESIALGSCFPSGGIKGLYEIGLASSDSTLATFTYYSDPVCKIALSSPAPVTYAVTGTKCTAGGAGAPTPTGSFTSSLGAPVINGPVVF